MGPDLNDYFEKGSGPKLLVRGHPYDFIETYDLLRKAYGYRSYYVNLGLWSSDLVPGTTGLDPAERLVRLLTLKSKAPVGADVLDVGSGLGQSAVHYVEWMKARRVTGINLNERQIAFASELARVSGFGDRIVHKKLDACRFPEEELGEGVFDAAFAVECMGHFKGPRNFLSSIARLLRPGGSFVFCLNVQKKEFSLPVKAMFKATYGFVPRPVEFWMQGLRDAGLVVEDSGDITEPVLRQGSEEVLRRLEDPAHRKGLPYLPLVLVKNQLRLVLQGVKKGELGYAWVSARATSMGNSRGSI